MTAEPTVKVALCVPAYNAARTLPRLLESARGQTAPFDEIWVYDDASRDDTAAVARAFGAQVVGGTTNVGCSAGKNALLAQVSSDWVHFHDADDFVHPEFVARVKARAAQDAFDVLLMDYEQVDEATGTQMSRSRFAESDLLADPLGYMLRHTVNNGGAYRVDLLRRVGGFDVDPAIRFNEDRMFHLRLVEAGARVAHEPYLGCRFYYSPDSMSAANQLKCTLANQAITAGFAARHPGRYARDVARRCWENAGLLASHGAWAQADACVELALRTYGRLPPDAGKLFTSLCAIDGKFALRLREALIRRFKPHLRPELRRSAKVVAKVAT
jgi:glycosyltransferase involved in cell wall biosynthesis